MSSLYFFPFQAMGTDCAVHLYAADQAMAEHIARSAIAEVMRIEQRYSRYRPDSDLTAINRVAEMGGSIEVDDETAGLLNYALAAYRKSEGLFDISSGLLRRVWNFKGNELPDQKSLDELLSCVGLNKLIWQAPSLTFSVPGMELDFGGLGKEYAADRAAEVCFANGVEHGVIDLGGDIHVLGPHPDGNPWQIGIRHPRHPGKMMAVASIKQGALATSGDYERCIEVRSQRYSHILNPKTGWPVQGLSSISVIADRCLVAGSVSTIAMLKGLDGIEWLNNLGVDHCWMDENGRCRFVGSNEIFEIPSST
jgi:thiamine biosynthesis lipoprotein